MSEASTSNQPILESKRRKTELDPILVQVKVERGKGMVADKAKANYLSGQLRVRLQYAKLKVEHGWQRQSLSEVENLYFRHTHLTRPYPVISPGGRRNGRPSHHPTTFASATPVQQQENIAASSLQRYPSQTAQHIGNGNGTFGASASLASLDSASTLSVPSTPVPGPSTSRAPTPRAPLAGPGGTTRYPLSRTDSTATVLDPVPVYASSPHTYAASSSTLAAASTSSVATALSQSFREPFDPMEPTEHLDSQLAALRSMISASSPVPLPPPPASASTPTPTSTQTAAPAAASPGAGGGLTYDSFWSTHNSVTAYRNMLGGGARGSPLQAHASAPAILPGNANGRGGGGAVNGAR
ncbi:uncharacterized protein BXZ73DRAFT_90954 [Epithele typhae]|uniref:uncharacterized protein n=1 Tax=Epithele typhae TaxID=378194 RepID=UPI0020085D33|nr:uncharacterized protein BXZ73DRAFT_90954 [Epithele typhae]KAH9926282.1 hypothetical protein BXZ73DRAFT_90954 [Epithele typhae]